MLRFTLFCCVILLIVSCTPPPQEAPKEKNPAAEGFDLEGSDEKAIAIADEVMEAMGGRANWDATRYIQWTFFGFRTLTWDKLEGRVRIDSPRDSMTYLVNIFDNTGKVFKAGEEMTHPDSLEKYVPRGKNIWINDSYWLVMPFKLKDSGVTLTYIGEDTTQSGEVSQLLELHFKDVGVTPQNKYRVWVSQTEKLVNQWAYYPEAADSMPRFVMPWLEYQTYGSIKLSGSRGERKLDNISVMDTLENAVFETL